MINSNNRQDQGVKTIAFVHHKGGTGKIFTIPFSQKIYKAQIKGMPISHYAPHSIVSKVYKMIATEVLNYE